MVNNVAGPAIEAAGCAQCHGSTVNLMANGKLDPNTWPTRASVASIPTVLAGLAPRVTAGTCFPRPRRVSRRLVCALSFRPRFTRQEVFEASKHGMAFAANRDKMNLTAKHGSPARTTARFYLRDLSHGRGRQAAFHPRCRDAQCLEPQHPGFGTAVSRGVRRWWQSANFRSRSRPRAPAVGIPRLDGTEATVKMVATPQRRRDAMTLVCRECHGKRFRQCLHDPVRRGRAPVQREVRQAGAPSCRISIHRRTDRLRRSTSPSSSPYWELWHDEGRARHGASMASPNHAWWEGIRRWAQFLQPFPRRRYMLWPAATRRRSWSVTSVQVEQHQWLKAPEKAAQSSVGNPRGGNE